MSLIVEDGSVVAGADAMSDASGIYAIINLITGRAYIGSAVNLRKRRNKHFADLEKGTHHSSKLQRSWLKHGPNAFSFKALLICDKDQLLFYEQRAMDVFQAAQLGYNVHPVAGSALGAKRTEEQRARMATAMRGKKRALASAEARANMSAARIGKSYCRGYKHTDEARAKMRARVITLEHRAALSASLLGNTRCLGFKHSQETRAKVSAAGKGKKYMLGKKLSEAWKAKIGAAQKGLPKPLKQRAKMAESAKLAWVKRREASQCH